MATYICHPPHRHHATRQVVPSEALSLLSAYLTAASTDASMHPNVLLTEAGPITPALGTHQLGLVLHNLKRVEAGLKGERLATDMAPGENGKGQGLISEGGSREPLDEEIKSAGIDTNGWQDKAEFEREQGIEQGEIGERSNASRNHVNGSTVPVVGFHGPKSDLDKDARKQRKKVRRLQDRKAAQAKESKERQLDRLSPSNR